MLAPLDKYLGLESAASAGADCRGDAVGRIDPAVHFVIVVALRVEDCDLDAPGSLSLFLLNDHADDGSCHQRRGYARANSAPAVLVLGVYQFNAIPPPLATANPGPLRIMSPLILTPAPRPRS